MSTATDQSSMERIPIEKLAKHFKVSIDQAQAAQDDLGFMYREVASPGQPTLLSVIEAEARRIAGMYPQSSDGRNTFVIFADWISNLAAQPPADPAVAMLRKMIRFYDAIDRAHDDGEAKLLDEAAAVVAAAQPIPVDALRASCTLTSNKRGTD